MTKPRIQSTDEQLGSAILVYLLLEKALQHMDDYPASELYSNEIHWFRTALREHAWLLSQFERYSPALLDEARKTGLQLKFDETQAGGGVGAVSP